MRAFGINPPDETSIRSTPKSFRCRDKTTDRSASQPPSTQSWWPQIRTKTGISAGTEFPDSSRDPQHEPHAIFEAAAVLVGAVIAERRQKLVHQIAVCRVQTRSA